MLICYTLQCENREPGKLGMLDWVFTARLDKPVVYVTDDDYDY